VYASFCYLTDGLGWTAQAEVSRTFPAKHHVTIGTEERFNTRQDQGNYDLPSHEFHLNDHRNSIVVAVYAEDQYKILRISSSPPDVSLTISDGRNS
jgi:hypothetical protein